MTSRNPISLEYASHVERRAAAAFHWLSLACGLIPLITGVGILLLFLLTHNDAFIFAGLVTLVVGGATVFIGFIFACIFRFQARRATIDRLGALYRNNISLVILAINLPAAIFCALAGISTASHAHTLSIPFPAVGTLAAQPVVTFVVKNKGTVAVDSGSISIGSQAFSIGSVSPGASITTRSEVKSFSGPMNLLLVRARSQATTKVSNYIGTDAYPLPRRFEIEVDDVSAKLVSW